MQKHPMMEIIMYKNLVLKNKFSIFDTFKYPEATMYTEKSKYNIHNLKVS